ncbi:hypothetical protein FA048_06960 [Pedobacter polaris]|uniref:Lipoprotein n=1 Tax=Pedobacter polaris TaxID=2571273 RepID=A0A4U1CQL9_9SPHI|nr:hypothetical protein [Pedobacter polaris]TKC09943.1 hypothetical protein FA048_06960 [Pedobacter polaris]
MKIKQAFLVGIGCIILLLSILSCQHKEKSHKVNPKTTIATAKLPKSCCTSKTPSRFATVLSTTKTKSLADSLGYKSKR